MMAMGSPFGLTPFPLNGGECDSLPDGPSLTYPGRPGGGGRCGAAQGRWSARAFDGNPGARRRLVAPDPPDPPPRVFHTTPHAPARGGPPHPRAFSSCPSSWLVDHRGRLTTNSGMTLLVASRAPACGGLGAGFAGGRRNGHSSRRLHGTSWGSAAYPIRRRYRSGSYQRRIHRWALWLMSSPHSSR